MSRTTRFKADNAGNSFLPELSNQDVLELVYLLSGTPESPLDVVASDKFWHPFEESVAIPAASGDGKFNLYTSAEDKQSYTLSDTLAALKGAGYTNTQIKDALNRAGMQTSTHGTWTTEDVKQYNIAYSKSTAQLQDYLTENYGNLDPYVSVISNKSGDTIVRVVYKDPTTGKLVYNKVPAALGTTYSDKELREIIDPANSELGKQMQMAVQQSETSANLKANALASVKLGDKVASILQQNPTLGSGLATNNTLSQAQIDAATAKTPDEQFVKDNLGVYSQSKDANIFNNIYQSLQSTNPQLISRTSLKGTDNQLGLEDLANAVSDEQLAITNRNIDNQKQQLLQQIRNDPELYNAITQQLRADNAAGTIAGQRAANAQHLVSQADTTYDKSASELYSSLFSGDKAVASSARSAVLGNSIAASDNYINSRLTQAEAAAAQGKIMAQELESLKQNVVEALSVDASKYDNALAVEQAKAGKNALDISSELSGNYEVQRAEEDSALKQVADLLGVSENYLQSAANGNADVAAALQTIINGFDKTGVVAGKDYTAVKTPDLAEPTQFTNKQYNDLLNSDAFKTLLYSDTIKAAAKQKTIEQLLSEYDLDRLTEDGMKALYEGYAKEANAQSDKIFNKAQRAYIAAITAGDAKTAEQLTKLAANAGVSKGNLYAASALANQFKQQSGLNNSGRQLATDFLNQQSTNVSTINQAALDANTALTKYLGDGSDTYGSGSFYGAFNQFNQNAADISKTYGELGSAVSKTTQGLNTSNVGNTVNNYDILGQLANQQTTINAAAAANNITNSGTRNTLGTEAAALKTQGNATLKKLK